MRRSAHLSLSLLLLIGVAACGDDDDPAAESTTTSAEPVELASSDLAEVEVSGAEGEAPTLDFPQPFGVTETERLVLTEGDGDLVEAGTSVTFHFLFVNARDGAVVESSYDQEPAQVPFADDLLPGVFAGLDGLPAGSRALTAIAPADGLGADPTVGLTEDDTVLFLVDVLEVRTPLTRAEGEAVAPVEGLPTVVLGDDGAPTITVPGGEPPEELVAQLLIEGTGPVVEAGQNLTVHYTGVLWAGGEVFDSSWTRGTPATFSIGTQSVIDGWDEGLVGRTVGSQVLLVVPPDKGYPEGTPDGSIGPGQTLVFVVDILDAS
ncbi:MAG: FKBP-type peptidyl-prolyl cis-trans isomerase [Acidimicrobiales bacterium]